MADHRRLHPACGNTHGCVRPWLIQTERRLLQRAFPLLSLRCLHHRHGSQVRSGTGP
jgi:hypothetical protein